MKRQELKYNFNNFSSEDNDYQRGADISKWEPETREAHNNLEDKHRQIGAIITGMSIEENINDEDILDLNETIGKEYIAAVTAATDKESPSHIQLMVILTQNTNIGFKELNQFI